MKFDSTILYVSDAKKAQQFYLGILGFVLDHEDGDYISMKANKSDESYICVNADTHYRTVRGHQTVVLKTAEIEKEYKRLQLTDIKIIEPLIQKSWGKTFVLTDPDGNRIEVLEQI